jgi:hypothetical protein
MHLPQELTRDIIAFLSALPNMTDKSARDALLNSVVLDLAFQQSCDVNQPAAQFFPNLVRGLEGYGRLNDGRDSIAAILEAARSSVGPDKKAEGNRLLRAIWQYRAPFVQGYQGDLAISYASGDDRLLPGTDAGWVTTLLSDLQKLLTQKLGLEQTYTVFMASEQEYFGPSAALSATVRHAAVALLIVSEEYLASPWCQEAGQAFLTMIAQRARIGSQVFVVERGTLEHPKPAAFADVPAYQFPDSEIPRGLAGQSRSLVYHNTMTRLSDAVAKELQRLRRKAAEPAYRQPAVTARATAPQPAVTPTGRADVLVFVHNDDCDDTLAADICALFDDVGLGWMQLPAAERPAMAREIFEQYVLDCDALMVVYGNVAFKWVGDQLLAVRKIAWKRDRPLVGMAVYDGPPPDKEPVKMRLPGMHVLACRDCDNAAQLRAFIESFRTKASENH